MQKRKDYSYECVDIVGRSKTEEKNVVNKHKGHRHKQSLLRNTAQSLCSLYRAYTQIKKKWCLYS